MSDAFSSKKADVDRLKLNRQEDDFSIKLTLDNDPKFWWRVEKSPEDGLVITDFTPGEQDDRTMAAALTLLLEDAGAQKPLIVTFHDLAPGATDSPDFLVRLNKVTQSAECWSQLAADQLNLQLSETRMRSHRGKSQLVVTFT